MMVSYSVLVEQVKIFLPDSLIPITFSKGQAIISFGAYHYPEVSGLNPYDEFLISIPVQYNKISKNKAARHHDPLFPQEEYNKGGSFIYYLPVTTEQSKNAGSKIWGFPKVVRKMIFSETEKTKTCKLYNGDVLEMTIEVEKITLPKQPKQFTYCSYTKKENKLLRTCVNASGNYIIKVRRIKATVTFGEGGMASEMQKLSLSKNPNHLFIAENLESDLGIACDTFIISK